MFFFSRWWYEQTIETRKEVLALYEEGRLEFLLGGWVANDEACPIYEEIEDNIMAGHEFLRRELKVTPPRIAWLVDSFGHGGATPDLFQKLGFDSLVFARVSDVEKEVRK